MQNVLFIGSSILELFIFPAFSLFFVLTCSFIWKSVTFSGKRQSKWDRAFLYLQYSVTLWTEPHLDSQSFSVFYSHFFVIIVCLQGLELLIFPVFICVFFVSTYSFLNEQNVKFIGKRQWTWKRPFCIGICSVFLSSWTKPHLDSQFFLCSTYISLLSCSVWNLFLTFPWSSSA